MHRVSPSPARSQRPAFRWLPPSSPCLSPAPDPLLVQKFAMHLHKHMVLLILFLEFPPTPCLPGELLLTLQGHVSTSTLFVSPLDVAVTMAMVASTNCSLISCGNQAIFNIYGAQRSLQFLYPCGHWSMAP